MAYKQDIWRHTEPIEKQIIFVENFYHKIELNFAAN